MGARWVRLQDAQLERLHVPRIYDRPFVLRPVPHLAIYSKSSATVCLVLGLSPKARQWLVGRQNLSATLISAGQRHMLLAALRRLLQRLKSRHLV